MVLSPEELQSLYKLYLESKHSEENNQQKYVKCKDMTTTFISPQILQAQTDKLVYHTPELVKAQILIEKESIVAN